MAALVVLMLICIAFGFYQKHSSRNAQPKQQEQATPMLSGRTLTLPPLSQIQPPEAPPARTESPAPTPTNSAPTTAASSGISASCGQSGGNSS